MEYDDSRSWAIYMVAASNYSWSITVADELEEDEVSAEHVSPREIMDGGVHDSSSYSMSLVATSEGHRVDVIYVVCAEFCAIDVNMSAASGPR